MWAFDDTCHTLQCNHAHPLRSLTHGGFALNPTFNGVPLFTNNIPMHSRMTIHVELKNLSPSSTKPPPPPLPFSLPSAWWNLVLEDTLSIIINTSTALIPVSKLLRGTPWYSLEIMHILYTFKKWVKGTVMRNATFLSPSVRIKHLTKLYLVKKRSLVIFLKCHMELVVCETTIPATTCTSKF